MIYKFSIGLQRKTWVHIMSTGDIYSQINWFYTCMKHFNQYNTASWSFPSETNGKMTYGKFYLANKRNYIKIFPNWTEVALNWHSHTVTENQRTWKQGCCGLLMVSPLNLFLTPRSSFDEYFVGDTTTIFTTVIVWMLK